MTFLGQGNLQIIRLISKMTCKEIQLKKHALKQALTNIITRINVRNVHLTKVKH